MTAAAVKPGGRAWGLGCGRLEPRHHVIVAMFLATFTAYVERVGFSIAFTSMAKQSKLDESVKGTVLSAFYWGYGLSQIPGGWAAQLYGGRRMLILSFATWSVVSLLTPGSADKLGRIITARVCVGLAQGFIIPAVHTVLAQWIPPHERARAVSLTTSGMYLGSAAAMLVLPSMATLLGPGALLRLVGLAGLAWVLLWVCVGRQSPSLRDTAIPVSLAASKAAAPAGVKGHPGPMPWGQMLRSPPVWAIVFNNFSFHYAFYVVMNWLPTYFNDLLKVELSSLGVVKTLPYLVMFALSNVGAWMGDWLITKRRKKVAAARKTVNTLGFLSSSLALLSMPCASGVVTGVLANTLTMGALGLSRGGFSVNHMDIAPKYAGIVMGISNTAGTLAGVVGVAVTGVLLDHSGGAANVRGWYEAYAVCAAVCVAASFVFNLLAKGERLFD